MEISEVMAELESRGLRAAIRNGVLKVGPGHLLDADLRRMVADYRADLMAHLSCVGDSDVEWRVASMLKQLLPLSWPCPVPTLYVSDAEANKENCGSCG